MFAAKFRQATNYVLRYTDLNALGIIEFKDAESVQTWIRDRMVKLGTTRLNHIKKGAEALSRDISKIFDGSYASIIQRSGRAGSMSYFQISRAEFFDSFRKAIKEVSQNYSPNMKNLQVARIVRDQIIAFKTIDMEEIVEHAKTRIFLDQVGVEK